jgi:hypothetical protein
VTGHLSFFEEIGVRTRPLENDDIALQFVDQQPIGLDVAFAPANIVTDNLVITVDRVGTFGDDQSAENEFEFLEVLSALLEAFDVLGQLLGIG